MINQLWFSRSFLYYLLFPLLWPLSLIYQKVSQSRRHSYQTGKKASFRANIPVVVVGNITAGGNGKTPVVIYLVEALQAKGYKVGVVSRGYGAKANYPLLVISSTPATESGDEPLLIKTRTDALVVVDPNRPAAVQKALEINPKLDVIITDDGLQHYALQRDIEIVVIDGQRRFGNEKFIPLGPLREGLGRLEKVDFLINNGGKPQGREISMSLNAHFAVNLFTGEEISVSKLKNVVAMAGIGHPPRFFKTLENLGADLIKTQAFADHQAFDIQTLTELAKQGDHLIMTEKDAVKCYPFVAQIKQQTSAGHSENLLNWWHLPVSAQIDLNQQASMMDKIETVINEYKQRL